MSFEDLGATFDQIWNQHELVLPQRRHKHCENAGQFFPVAEEICTNAIQDPTTVKVNQSVLLLTHKYMQFRAFSDRRHRNYTGTGHTCIFHIFVAAYDRLKMLELSLTPPMLFEPQPPPTPPAPPQPPTVAGMLIGLEDE